MVIVAAIGFAIGVINMSGIGLKFAQTILSASGSSLFPGLILVMPGCLVMGMGVPSAPACLIVAIVMGSALEQAAFAAAPIAGSKPIETGVEAVRLSIVGFIISFLFVYHPTSC